MYFNNELSDLKDCLLNELQDLKFSDVARDWINFFLWELKFLDCFLHLKSFPFASECANKVDYDVSPKFVMEVIDVFVGNINVLVKITDPSSWCFVPGHRKEQIEQVLKELKLLRFFVCFVSNKCSIQPQYRCTTFYTHALIEASHIAMVVWLHLPIYGNGNQDLAPSEVNHDGFPENDKVIVLLLTVIPIHDTHRNINGS
ncbi:hypothetical protein H5410_025608 [Solanum commersonii]|uniref:Late blight resistance protein R1A-like N-terminal domain-containing protein n=1 Tax=Solanum commersonii TaxID=4109 RepID=A0A9J5YYG1_SOLCO|nr:hypothetical protein H5410_025608 [Solanum commersonii]